MDFFIKNFDSLTKNELYEILRSRAEIFIKEQKMNCIDPDGEDIHALHIFCLEKNRITTYLRAFKINSSCYKIGRVLSLVHNQGLGTKLINFAADQLKNRYGCKKIILDAQKQAIQFYQKLDFTVTSEEFLEEGVIHVSMEKKLQD